LLQTLPKDGGRDGEKKVSKSEVLVLAKQHIQQLEEEKSVLEKERQELEASVEEMRRKWIRLGGVCLP
jgi:predicted nuclease with TOPRIM domain